MSKEKEDFNLRQTQLHINVSFTAFMTAVVVFFTGLLLTKFESFDISVKIPILFLIISMFGFLYSTLVFSNAAEDISQKRLNKAMSHMLLGDVLSEYLGVYFLILSIPLVINIITSDLFLRIVTLIVSLAGLIIYQFSHVSIIERHFEKTYHIFSIIIILFGLILFLAQLYNLYFIPISTFFIIFMLIITYFAVKKK